MLRIILIASLAAHFGLVSRLSGSPPAASDRAAAIQVLQREAEARDGVDRRLLLRDEIDLAPDCQLARWQAGYVYDRGEWRPFEEAQALDDPVHVQYRSLREAAREDVESQLRVANWCKAQRLHDQERAHLTAALALSAGRDLPAVRSRLGYKLVGGRWLTRDELAGIDRHSRELARSMKTWAHRLESIADRLAGSRRQRESALMDLTAISDPDVIAAAELVLAPAHERASREAVHLFARLDDYRSSLALTRLAALSTWPSVRSAAVEVLKSRRQEEFMPVLVGAMHRPAESAFEILIGPKGELSYTYICARETANHWQLVRFRTSTFFPNAFGAGHPFAPAARKHLETLRHADRIRFLRERNDIVRSFQDDFHQREATRARHTEHTREFNNRIGRTLAEITGHPFTAQPSVWWARWIDELDVEPARSKNVLIVGEEQQYIPLALPRFRSCLAAGTTVWTDRGAAPIDDVQIGDRVLSKDIDTGELAYKPVVLTTKREAPTILRLTLGEESLELTAGHPVWVSGSGWTKARDLTSGQPLHTVTGTVATHSVEPLGSGTVYNLVVADFHTYFFGNAKILSHDTTIPTLTNVRVPGLPPEHSHPE